MTTSSSSLPSRSSLTGSTDRALLGVGGVGVRIQSGDDSCGTEAEMVSAGLTMPLPSSRLMEAFSLKCFRLWDVASFPDERRPDVLQQTNKCLSKRTNKSSNHNVVINNGCSKRRQKYFVLLKVLYLCEKLLGKTLGSIRQLHILITNHLKLRVIGKYYTRFEY